MLHLHLEDGLKINIPWAKILCILTHIFWLIRDYVYISKYYKVMLSGDRLPRKKQMEKCEKCCPPNAGQIKQRSLGQTAQKDI
jgi:hypothetical protein